METPSFVSKARTAFHSAAAKAERVFTDFKSDRDSDKTSPSLQDESQSKDHIEAKHSNTRWRPAPLGIKQDWQDRIRNIRIGRRGAEEPEKADNTTMAAPFYDENLYILNMKNDVEAKARQI
ncbi:hypothetical protein Patl1_04165 [Pistacia atlantica]|uniref:Uncharacterized protein n=1 Tax=Pistacia atlantica TaxID=434234 RepID=A0ACC1BQG1_9ROSI|nr:hypothetical protein Patl1_04165 [Pistacia atlantica]